MLEEKQASVHYCVKQETILKLTISQVIDIYPKSSKLSINYKKNIAENFVFVPHLTPMIRGMQATIYLHLKEGTHPEEILRSYYKDNPFIDIMESGSMPETRSVRGANICRISIQRAPQNNNVWIILSVIDNLVKGAAGQAVQI